MSEKKSNDQENHSNEDEDFGLPEVNITPLSEETKQSEKKEVPAPILPTEAPPSAVKTTNEAAEDRKEKKDHTSVIIIILLLLFLGAGYGLYYFKVFDWAGSPESEESAFSKIEDEPEAIPPEPEVQEDIIEEPEEIKLTEITSKIEVPRYFVVVGSFIDDDLAKDYSEKLNKMGKNTFLIHPYGDIAFYRLSVGQFENLDAALTAIDGLKSDFEENLWVLKY